MIARGLIFFFSLSQILSSCTLEPTPPSLEFREIIVPTIESGQSRVFTSRTGDIYLSWIEYTNNDSFALQYSKWNSSSWKDPITITSGKDWFVNWADFPSLVVTDDGDMAAHWLQMRGSGTFEYDIHIAQSSDGATWDESFIPHRDRLAAEHGFVSMQPFPNGDIMAVWLDGRNSTTNIAEEETKYDGHGRGAMTLRTATFDPEGVIHDEKELDQRICDCCQTDMAITKEGPVVVCI